MYMQDLTMQVPRMKTVQYRDSRLKISRLKTHEYQYYQEFKISIISNLIRNFIKTPRKALAS